MTYRCLLTCSVNSAVLTKTKKILCLGVGELSSDIMDRDKLIVPNQIGYLILKDDGAVLESGGDLKNDERSANIIMGLLYLTESIDDNFIPNSSCERISIDYEHHSYSICMSNRHIYIVKMSKGQNGVTTSSSSSTSVYNDANNEVNNSINPGTVMA